MPNFSISDLAPVTLPIDVVTTFFELQTVEGGIQVSRKMSAQDLGIGGSVTAVAGGTNITIDNTDPMIPIVNLDAAITGVSVNGVTLNNAGAATNYLDEQGNYTVPGADHVDGPASSVNNRLVTFDGVTGKLIQDATTITALGAVLDSATSIVLSNNGNPRVVAQTTGLGVFGTTIDVLDTSGPSFMNNRMRNTFGGVNFRLTATGGAEINQTNAAGTIEDLWIDMVKDAEVALYHNGIQKITTDQFGALVRGSIVTDVPAGNDADVSIRLQDVAGTEVGSIGYLSTGDYELIIKNEIWDSTVRLIVTDDAGVETPVGNFGWEGSSILYGGASGAAFIDPLQGALRLNNLVTGRAGNPTRALTAADPILSENWTFNTATTAPPTDRTFRMNNVTPASVTSLLVDDLTESFNDFGIYFGAELTTGDVITLKQQEDQTKWLIVTLTGPPVDQTSYWTIPVSVVSSGVLFDADATVTFNFASAASLPASAGSVPGGFTQAVQFNNAGVFGGAGNFEWNDLEKKVTLTHDAAPGSGRPAMEFITNVAASSVLEFNTNQSSGSIMEINANAGVSVGFDFEANWSGADPAHFLRFTNQAGSFLQTWQRDGIVNISNGQLVIDPTGNAAVSIPSSTLLEMGERGAANPATAGVGQIWVNNNGLNPANLFFTNENSDDIDLTAELWFNAIRQVRADSLGIQVRDTLHVGDPDGGSIKINEQINADVDEIGFHQIWTLDNAPTELYMTDDTGQDFPVGMNAMPPIVLSAGRSVSIQDNGRNLVKTGAALIIMNAPPTVVTNFVDGWMCGFSNFNAAGNLRLAPLSGTLTHIEPDGTITNYTFGGSIDFLPGFVGTIWKFSATQWYVWGSDRFV